MQLGVLLALPQLFAFKGVPSSRLVDHAVFHAHIQQRPLQADALGIHDVELSQAERRSALVLGHLRPCAIADHLRAALDGFNAADVQAHRRVELQRPPARGGLGRAEHHAHFLAQLVDEHASRARLVQVGSELAHRLRHEPRLQPHMRVAHLALQLGSRRQSRNRVDHDHINRPRANELVGDVQRLLAGVGLRDEKVVYVHADGGRIHRVHSVLGVNESAHAAGFLRLCHDVESQSRLPRRLRAVDLGHPTSWHPADAQSDVKSQRTRGDRLHPHRRPFAHLHDGAEAVSLLYLLERHVERLVALGSVAPTRFAFGRAALAAALACARSPGPPVGWSAAVLMLCHGCSFRWCAFGCASGASCVFAVCARGCFRCRRC